MNTRRSFLKRVTCIASVAAFAPATVAKAVEPPALNIDEIFRLVYEMKREREIFNAGQRDMELVTENIYGH